MDVYEQLCERCEAVAAKIKELQLQYDNSAEIERVAITASMIDLYREKIAIQSEAVYLLSLRLMSLKATGL